MRPALPWELRLLDKASVGLVDQRGGLQSVVAALGTHIASGQTTQLRVNLRDKLGLDFLISCAELHQQSGDRVVGASRPRCECSHTFGSGDAGL